jgi:hypothetical protein
VPSARRGDWPLSRKSKGVGLERAARLVRRICRIAGNPRLIDELAEDLAKHGVQSAIQRRDTSGLFDWLFEAISYQGIGNYVAHGYMERHGRVRWDNIAALIERSPPSEAAKLLALRPMWVSKGRAVLRGTEPFSGLPLADPRFTQWTAQSGGLQPVPVHARYRQWRFRRLDRPAAR